MRLLSDPKLSCNKLGEQLSLSHTTVSKLRKKAEALGLEPFDVIHLPDETLVVKFELSPALGDFKPADWEVIFNYLNQPRAWGTGMNTQHSAWLIFYVQKYWPTWAEGCPLPADCMSERTFNRRYKDYLCSIGMGFVFHTRNALADFGPGSMMEIDTIGNRLPYFDENHTLHKAVIFTAVSKYSGKIYAEAMPDNKGPSWCNAILNAFWFFGGLFQVCRMDNDSAICSHNRNAKRLRPVVLMTFMQLKVVGTDLCPKSSPRWKGTNETSNGLLERQLFADTSTYQIPLLVKDLNELNKLILKELERINQIPRKDCRLSREALFEKYEKQHLLPLPRVRPEIPNVMAQAVKNDGYVHYKHHFYYAGSNMRGKEILVQNIQNLRLKLLTDRDFKEIVEYDLNTAQEGPSSYYKDEKFKSEVETILSRPKSWFVDNFNQCPGEHGAVLELIEEIWKNNSAAEPVATRQCNLLWQLYEKHPQDLEALNATCAFTIQNKHYADFINSFKYHFKKIKALAKGCENGSMLQQLNQEPASKTNQTAPASKGAFVRRGDFYDKFK